MRCEIKSFLTASVLAGLISTVFAQSNLYVATNGDDAANSGQSWASPYATISNGVAHASTAGDTVWVSNGTYVLSAELTISRAITVSAWSASAADTGIGGNGAVRCVSISAAATLAGFTVSNGVISGDGGAIYLNNSSGVVTNCVITRNQTTGGNGRGGGVYMTAGKVIDCTISYNESTAGSFLYGGGGLWGAAGNVLNCVLISNVVHRSSYGGGGGIGIGGTATFIVSNCVFSSNRADYGGGVCMGSGGSYARILDCTFSNNVATNGVGGAIYGNGGIISNCVMARNQATAAAAGIYLTAATGVLCVIQENLNHGYGGGGVEMAGGSLLLNSAVINNTNLYPSVSGGVFMRGTTSRSTLRNCLIAGNVITGNYGTAGVQNHSTDGTNSVVQNCTIVFNRANAPGSGSIGGATLSTNSFEHYGNIIYYNTGTYKANWNDSDVPNFYVLNTCITPTNSRLLGTGNITNAPLFMDTNSANYRLSKGSPCINTGLNQDWMIPPGSGGTVDLDDRVRIRYGTVDMGAYEAIYNAFIFTAY